MRLGDARENYLLAFQGVLSNATFKWYRLRLESLVKSVGINTENEAITIHDLRKWRGEISTRTALWENGNSPSRLSEKMLVNSRNPDFGCVRARF